MATPNTQVMLVSDQAAANLLPALDPELKPDAALLVVSQKMVQRASDLEAVLNEAGVKSTRILLDDEHDFSKLQDSLLGVATEHASAAIALNLTGGTKLMALAAQSVAQAAEWQSFYVDVDRDEVIWLDRDSLRSNRRQPLTQQLRLRHYLRGYGFTLEQGIERPQMPPEQQDLTATLIQQIDVLEFPIGQLNWIAQKAEEKQRLDWELDYRQQDSRGLDALLRHFEAAGVLERQGVRVQFRDEAARAFAKGGWLERHVFRTLCSLSTELDVRDKAANLVVTDGQGVRNELDVAFLANNRLHAIECKTARMDNPDAPKANDALFKLSEVSRRVGGLGSRALLVSYRPLREAERQLAKALRIELACGPELQQLEQRLRRWVG